MAEKKRKQVLLRLAPELYEELARWADDEFRSINGQIEYLLTTAVRKERRPRSAPGREKKRTATLKGARFCKKMVSDLK